jgi:hypothetical protein
MDHFIAVYGRMVKDGWLDQILIGRLDDDTFYCAIYADRMGIAPYRFAKDTTPFKAFQKAFNSVVAMNCHIDKRKPTDDII